MKKIIGQLIEEKVKASKIEVTTFAKAINKERSNVYDIFKRDSIDTDLLKKIGQVLNYDFFQDLLEPETKQKIALTGKIQKTIYVPISFTDEDMEKIEIEEKIVNVLKKK